MFCCLHNYYESLMFSSFKEIKETCRCAIFARISGMEHWNEIQSNTGMYLKLLLYIATAMYDERDALHMTVTHVCTYLHLIVIG